MYYNLRLHEVSVDHRGSEGRHELNPSVRAGPQTIPPATRMLAHLQATSTCPPYPVIFTISPSWLAKAGTVALGITPGPSSSSAEGKAHIITRSDGKENSWRPGSIFGGLWSSAEPAILEKLGDEEGGEEGEEEEGEGTIKGGGGTEATGDEMGGPRPSRSTGQQSQSTKARLSSLFTDWIAPEASAGASRIVLAPVALSDSGHATRRLSRYAPRDRMSMIEVASQDEVEEEEEDLDSALESLMVRLGRFAGVWTALTAKLTQDELGMKPGARTAMRQMPVEGKRKLLATHRPTASPLRPSKTGPDPSNEVGALAGLKRFSLASVGWNVGSLDDPPPQPNLPSRPSTMYNAAPTSPALPAAPQPPQHVSAPSSTATETPQSWTSWWSAASNPTGVAQVSEQAKDTPQFYVDQLRSVCVWALEYSLLRWLTLAHAPTNSKISQRSLVKHLIALRVRLSTAKLSWTQEFLGPVGGLDALEGLLGKITLKQVNQ